MDYEISGSTDPTVQEARDQILRILDASVESEYEMYLGRVRNFLDAARVVFESTWYLKLGGQQQCAVCRQKEGKMFDIEPGVGPVCARHAAWRVIVLHDRAPWREIIEGEMLKTRPARTNSSKHHELRRIGTFGRKRRYGGKS